MLMASLTEQANSDTLDIVRWLNFTTFDIIGDLAFSESFRSLESRVYNPWVLSIFRGLRGVSLVAMLSQYPIFQSLIKGLELSSSIKQFDELLNHGRNKAKARMEYGTKRFERKDFMTYMLDGKPGMETEEILQNAPVLVIAGSETVATALAGFFFYVGQHPEVYAKAAKEIRSAFSSESEITIAQITSLRYLTAVIQETLRIYPPAPVTPERLSPGDTIDGKYVPEGVLNFSQELYYQHLTLTHIRRLWSPCRCGQLSETRSTGLNQTPTSPNDGCRQLIRCMKIASVMTTTLYLSLSATVLETALAKTSHLWKCVSSLRSSCIALTLSSCRVKRLGKAASDSSLFGRKGLYM